MLPVLFITEITQNPPLNLVFPEIFILEYVVYK